MKAIFPAVAGSKTTTITATHSKGNTSTAMATVTVKDPTAACRPAARYMDVGGIVMPETERAGVAGKSITVSVFPNPTNRKSSIKTKYNRGRINRLQVISLGF